MDLRAARSRITDYKQAVVYRFMEAVEWSGYGRKRQYTLWVALWYFLAI